jgi:GNAT superfamily N-acetyltransferase
VIRDTRDDDAPGVVHVLNQVYPAWLHTEKGWRHRRASEPEKAHPIYLVAEDEGRIVGVGGGRIEYEAARPGTGRVGVSVLEEARGRGIGGRLYERAEAHVVSHGARRLRTTSNDDDASRRFVASRGFRHTLTERVSGVDPREIDLSELSTLETAKAAEGFRLVTMNQVSAEEIYRIDIEATRDIPMDEPFGDISFDDWERKYWRHPNVTLEGSRVVVHDGRAVSFAMIHADLDRGKATNEMTGTLRDFRGRRLARLAKLATIEWAVEHGITQILTGNDETNAPMLAINVSLGYRPIAAELSWVKDL